MGLMVALQKIFLHVIPMLCDYFHFIKELALININIYIYIYIYIIYLATPCSI